MSDNQVALLAFIGYLIVSVIALSIMPYSEANYGSSWLWSFTTFFSMHFATVYYRWKKIGNSQNVLSVSVPKFMPPTQLSPAASLYLSTQGDVSEKQLFLSTIFGLIAKNVLKFDEQAFKRVSSNASSLSNDEIVFLKLMNLSEPAIEHPVDPEHPNWSSHIRRIQSALNEVIHDDVYDFISHNVKHIRREIVFVVALLALFCSGYPSGAMYFILIPPIFLYVWRSNITRKVLVLNIFLIVGVFISREGDGYDLLMYTVPYMAIGIVIVSTLLLITELRNYSPTGAEQMDQLNGFLRYVSEPNKNVFANEPALSANLYLNGLPYAFSMDILDPWRSKFADNILTWSQDDEVAADEREILQDCENFISSLTEIEELLFSPRPD